MPFNNLMNVQIRKAEDKDVAEIAGVIRSLGFFAHITNESPQATEERVQKHFAQCIADDSHLVLVAQGADGKIAGYCAVHWMPSLFLAGPQGYVSELFIKEEFRGQGIGGYFLNAVKTEAKKRGCARLMLLNMRRRESYQRRFYPKQGWEEWTDAATFVLDLSKTGES